MNAKELVGKLHWLGHDSFRIDVPPTIYLDPWQLRGDLPAAGLVLVSHDHHDHCSPEDVQKVLGPDTVVIADRGAAAKLRGARTVRPGDRVRVAGIEIEAVAAYNVDKFRSPGVPFHPKQASHVGYLLVIDGVRVYFAGDSDFTPEMGLVRCDVALLPVSGIYVMTAEQAAHAARALRPAVVVPMHYGSGIGSVDDAQRFASLYDGEIALLERD